jgi:hypothetical protein
MNLLDTLKPASPIPTSHEDLPRRTHRMGDDEPKKKRLAAIAAAAEKQPARASPPPKENNMPKDKFEKLEQFLKDNTTWHGPTDIAKALGQPRVGTLSRLATLAKQKKIQALGNRRGLRYAALGVEKPNGETTVAAPATTAAPAPAPRRAGAKAAGKAARAQRDQPARTEASFIVDDAGRVTVVGADGARVELTLPDTKRLAGFIDRTKSFRG